jgi:hypothetical protein
MIKFGTRRMIIQKKRSKTFNLIGNIIKSEWAIDYILWRERRGSHGSH